MTWQPRRWAGGLLIPAAFWALGTIVQAPRIADDLATRTGAALKAAGLDWVKPQNADGRDVAVAGTAPDEAALAQARQIADTTWGVRRVDQVALSLIPEAKPYFWSAERSSSGIVIRGVAPSEAVKALVASAAKAAFSGLNVTDETVLAQGAPAGFADTATIVLSDLAKLESGSVILNDNAFTIRGQALDFPSYDSLMEMRKTLPPVVQLARAEITPPRISPFVWTASWKDNRLQIEGVTPADNARAELSARAAQVFPGAALTDASRVAQGAPTGNWIAAARFAFDQLAQMTEGEARLSDGRLTIAGTGKIGFGNAQLASAASGLPAEFSLAPGSISIPEPSPYSVLISRKATVWTISGYAPSEAAKALLASNLRAAGASEITDTVVIAPGLPKPMDFGEVTGLMAAVLARLESGEAKLIDHDLTISGAAADRTVGLAVASLLHGGLPPGLNLKTEEISQPVAPSEPESAPYAWSASIVPGVLTMAGNYPDEKSHQELLERAGRLFQGDKLIDRMKEARGASRHFMDAALTALEKLSRVETGDVAISGETMVLKGDTLLASAAGRLRDSVSDGLPAGWTAAATVAPEAPLPEVANAACQQLLRDLLKSGHVYFENGRADINKDAFRLLDRLTVTVRRCPAARIEISGHTDSDGSQAFNQDLSERRAYAVVDYMIRNGNVDSSRLSAVGYGLSKPVASNDTEEGKARNRRIEFTVR